MTVKYDTVFFDLDGTVTDSAPGILNCVRYALHRRSEELGVKGETFSDADLNCFVGPPLIDSFEKFIPCSREEAEKCLVWYRERFRPKGIYENSVYPGVVELLESLRSRGVKIVLTTAKPEEFAEIILDHFGLTRYFDAVYGATMDESRNKKHQVIAWALTHSGDVGRVVLLGDRENDVTGARLNGIDCIGALWGYGSAGELREAGAEKLCRTPAAVLDFID